ncbi:MAG TPA: nucleotide exchange factor GrpE [Bryobacterales bacterium]|nr:nucleotide exchange factor GrpE [Bryobacterales bacterium]
MLGEFQKGYNFKGRLLRPAMVKVAVRPPDV